MENLIYIPVCIMTSGVFLIHFYLRLDLSLNSRLISLARNLQKFTCLYVPPVLGFQIYAGDLNSHPHGCEASTLPLSSCCGQNLRHFPSLFCVYTRCFFFPSNCPSAISFLLCIIITITAKTRSREFGSKLSRQVTYHETLGGSSVG